MSADQNRWEPGTETAQEALKRLIADYVAPFLRSQGYKGSRPNFRLDSGDFRGQVNFQGSVHNTKNLAEFTINISARHRPSKEGYWGNRIGFFLPGMSDTWWRVPAGAPLDGLAADLIDSLGTYGLVAIEAALDHPEFPPDLTRRWARTFPEPDLSRPAGPPRIPGTEPDIPFNLEQTFAELLSDTEGRAVRIGLVMELAPEDPRALAGLLQTVDSAPRSYTREFAARCLAFVPGDREVVLRSLDRVQAEDENLRVRIAARFALAVLRRQQTA